MTKKTEFNLQKMTDNAYPTASNERNTYPRNYMLRTLVDQAYWPANTKLNDAATKYSQAKALTEETVGVEQAESGRVVMHPGTTSIGAPHANEDQANRLIDYAERDEEESAMHQAFLAELIAAYEAITGEKYVPKAQRGAGRRTKSAAQRLAEKQVAAE